jgi:hypothetical protein
MTHTHTRARTFSAVMSEKVASLSSMRSMNSSAIVPIGATDAAAVCVINAQP